MNDPRGILKLVYSKGRDMDSEETVVEPTAIEVIPPTPVQPEPIELPIPALDWCSASVAEFGHIQNLCQQLSNNQWNIVQILPVKGKLVGSEGYGVVAFRAQALRYIDQPPIDQTPSNTPDDRYMGR